MRNRILRSKQVCSMAVMLISGIVVGNVFAAQDNLSSSPLASERARAAEDQDKDHLRIICFGAHPDDCEIRAGGVAAMWAAKGHKVKFVSTTNGDIGHWKSAGGPLAIRRLAEVQKAAKILGIETQVLDIHDGELMPTLENRRTITRLIREWRADIVMVHRPNDYHPDHRYSGILIQDAAFMVTCPFFCPDVPHLTKNPIFMYFSDNFKKPNLFQPEIVVPIDSVIEKKLDALLALESQFIEGCVSGHEGLIPKTEQERVVRFAAVRKGFENRFASIADKYRDVLIQCCGEEVGKNAKYAEAFELCEYGRQPAIPELRRIIGLFAAPSKN